MALCAVPTVGSHSTVTRSMETIPVPMVARHSTATRSMETTPVLSSHSTLTRSMETTPCLWLPVTALLQDLWRRPRCSPVKVCQQLRLVWLRYDAFCLLSTLHGAFTRKTRTHFTTMLLNWHIKFFNRYIKLDVLFGNTISTAHTKML